MLAFRKVVTCFCGAVYDDMNLDERRRHAWCDWQPAAEMAESAGGQRDTDPCPPPEMDLEEASG